MKLLNILVLVIIALHFISAFPFPLPTLTPTPTPSSTPTPPPTSNPTSSPPPTSNPTSSPVPPVNTPPVSLWGIFQDNYGNYNISSYNIVNGNITNYPISSEFGSVYGFVSVNQTTVVFICGDYVSLSIISMDLATSYSNYLQTIAYSQAYNMFVIPGTYQYNQETQTLFATGYLTDYQNSNITIFGWDFQSQEFDNFGIVGEDISTDHTSFAVFDQSNSIYYVNIYDTKFNADIIYAFNTSSVGKDDSIGYVLSNVAEYEILYLVQTSNGQIYGVSNDDNGFIMIYSINLTTGQVSLFYHLKNTEIETTFPVVAYNQYLVILSDPNYSSNGNQVTLLNTVNRQAKTYPIGINGVLPNSGGFFTATNF